MDIREDQPQCPKCTSVNQTCKSSPLLPHIDKKCPFTGNVSIRGRILTGVVKSTKMNRTIIIRRDYLHFIPKYRRYEKRHKNLAVHCSPAFRVEVGDQVTVGQCRPLSKTVRFNVLRVLPNLRVSPGGEILDCELLMTIFSLQAQRAFKKF